MSASRSQPSELTLQRVDLCKVAARVVVAASLAGSESEAPARVSVTGAVSAQMDDRCEVLPLLQRSCRNAVAGEGARDRAIQQRGGHLHSMSGHHTSVERVEPTRLRVIPGAVLDDDVIGDAIAAGLGERAIGDLKIPTALEAGPYSFERIPAEPPPPIRPCDRVAAALHLGQSGQQFWCDDLRGVLVEKGPYCRQVCAGTLASEPLTAPAATNTSVGLRTTCTIQFTAAQTIASRTVPTINWTANGAVRRARNARRPGREAERRVRRPRMRVGRSAARAIIAWGMTDTHPLSHPDRKTVRPQLTLRASIRTAGVLHVTSNQSAFKRRGLTSIGSSSSNISGASGAWRVRRRLSVPAATPTISATTRPLAEKRAKHAG